MIPATIVGKNFTTETQRKRKREKQHNEESAEEAEETGDAWNGYGWRGDGLKSFLVLSLRLCVSPAR
jgi:hypothetical protein